MATIGRYGGPIVYLIVYGLFLMAILVWADSGSIFARRPNDYNQTPLPNLPILPSTKGPEDSVTSNLGESKEAKDVSESSDLLRVLHITKAFSKKSVLEDVTIGVPRSTVFAILGPNGAGKSTTFSIISGDIVPNNGDVLINDVSVVHHPRIARVSLGVCPQFTAIDAQLTVREHLVIYARLKGVTQIDQDVERLMEAMSLNIYADRLASKLSGGNKRKLSLAIALIGRWLVLPLSPAAYRTLQATPLWFS